MISKLYIFSVLVKRITIYTGLISQLEEHSLSELEVMGLNPSHIMHEITVSLPNPFLEVFLEWRCCRGCGFVAKQKCSPKAQFWPQSVPLVLAK